MKDVAAKKAKTKKITNIAPAVAVETMNNTFMETDDSSSESDSSSGFDADSSDDRGNKPKVSKFVESSAVPVFKDPLPANDNAPSIVPETIPDLEDSSVSVENTDAWNNLSTNDDTGRNSKSNELWSNYMQRDIEKKKKEQETRKKIEKQRLENEKKKAIEEQKLKEVKLLEEQKRKEELDKEHQRRLQVIADREREKAKSVFDSDDDMAEFESLVKES